MVYWRTMPLAGVRLSLSCGFMVAFLRGVASSLSGIWFGPVCRHDVGFDKQEQAGLAPHASRPVSLQRVLPVSGLLFVRNSGDRRFIRADGTACNGFHHFARGIRIGNPLLVEIVRTCSHTLVARVRVDQAGVSAVQEFEQMIFGLH